jgi:hypothetical protein
MAQINYYDVVASAAQMENAPEITWQKVLQAVQRFTKAMGVDLDEHLLREAWREFRKAKQFISYKRR